jgi:hypothetical protein
VVRGGWCNVRRTTRGKKIDCGRRMHNLAASKGRGNGKFGGVVEVRMMIGNAATGDNDLI